MPGCISPLKRIIRLWYINGEFGSKCHQSDRRVKPIERGESPPVRPCLGATHAVKPNDAVTQVQGHAAAIHNEIWQAGACQCPLLISRGMTERPHNEIGGVPKQARSSTRPAS